MASGEMRPLRTNMLIFLSLAPADDTSLRFRRGAMNSYEPPAGPSAESIAGWIRAAWPDIEVEPGAAIRLRSSHRSEAELRMIWKAAAWNEHGIAANSTERRAVLDLLLS
jgi:hypothetical protein